MICEVLTESVRPLERTKTMGRKPLGAKSKIQMRENEELGCKYNAGVLCKRKERMDAFICQNCGWNPSEIEKRHHDQRRFMVTE